MAAKSDFGRAVADIYRDLQKHVQSIPVNTPEASQSNGIDRSVKEQVIGDIDRMIDHHEGRKPFPVV